MNTAKTDIVGRRNGMLVCTKYVSSGRLELTCDCGETFWGDMRTLNGTSGHCGCFKTFIKAGDVFGKWTVIGRKGMDSKSVRYKTVVECSCGKREDVTAHALVVGKLPFCPCDRGSENHGKRFGRLVIVGHELERFENGAIRYTCKCDCGNIYTGKIADLIRGNTQSCGCIQKEYASQHMKEVWAETKAKGLFGTP